MIEFGVGFEGRWSLVRMQVRRYDDVFVFFVFLRFGARRSWTFKLPCAHFCALVNTIGVRVTQSRLLCIIKAQSMIDNR